MFMGAGFAFYAQESHLRLSSTLFFQFPDETIIQKGKTDNDYKDHRDDHAA